MESLCGFRLSTVGVIVGWLGALGSFISLVILSVCINNVDYIAQTIYDGSDNKDNITVVDLTIYLTWFFAIYLALAIINLVSSALLVAGTVKERHLLLVPWLFNTGISMFFGAIYFICLVIFGIGSSMPFGTFAVGILSTGLSLFIQYIIWSAIHSLFKQIRTTQDQRQQLLNPTSSPAYPSYTKL